MHDPHVERLHYTASSDTATIAYKPDAAPMSFVTALGKFELRDGKLSVEPAEHFADEDGARQVIEGFLRAWEIEADLTMNPGQLRFKFASAEVVDRSPAPRQIGAIEAKGAALLVITGRATLSMTCAKYPEPPSAFAATVDVQRAHRRWRQYRDGKEPLQSMAYFVLTVIETLGTRKVSAATLGIDPSVLGKIGELSSIRGSIDTARKAPDDGHYRELSGAEQSWLENAVRQLIKRLGEHAAGKPGLPLLTMKDLPALP